MELVPGLHRIDTPLGNRVSSLYLVVGDRSTLLFDTGVDGTIPAHVLPYLSSIGVPTDSVRHVVVSHADVDHCGGIADAREAFPAAVLCAGREDAPLMADYATFLRLRGREFHEPWGLDESPEGLAWMREVCREGPLDWHLTGGERVDLGGRTVEILHVPGHSRGHLAVHDPASGAVLVSDAVLGDAVRTADGSPAFPPTYRFVDSYLATVLRLEGLAPDLLLTAHYPTMAGEEALAFLAASRDFASALEEAVLRAVRSAPAPMTLEALCTELNPTVGRWPSAGTVVALAFPVVGHVERLVSTGALALSTGPQGRRLIGAVS